MHLLIMGPPGAGKGTQAVSIAKAIGGVHISTGDIFRQNVADQTDLGRAAQSYMDAGEYVPDSVTNAMVRSRLDQQDARQAFVLDGYPRTLDQVAELDAVLTDLGVELHAAVSLDVPTDVVVGRLLQRALDSGRSDDTEDVIRRRQEVYLAETAPLLDVYETRRTLLRVDGVGATVDVFHRIIAGIFASPEHA